MAVLLFILALTASISGEHTQFLISQLSTHLVGPPFFENVTTEGKIGFYKVLNNKTLTRNQQREMLIKWGEENEVEAPVRSYIDKQSRSLHEFRENINLFLMQLLDYEKEIDSVYFDDNLTVEQREHLLFTLDCPAQIKKILSYAATAVKRYGLPQPKRTSRAPTTTAYKGSVTVAPTAGNKTNTTVTSTPAAGNTTASSGNATITTSATVIPATSSNITAPSTVTNATATTAAGNSTTVTTTVTPARAVPNVPVTTAKATNVTTSTASTAATTTRATTTVGPTTTTASTAASAHRVLQNRG